MAILYNGEIISNKALKQKIKSKTNDSSKKNKEKNNLTRRDIWFIGYKPNYNLYEGRILEELETTYKVRVKARRKDYFDIFEVPKNKVQFDN